MELLLSLQRATPRYYPDEVIYSQIARSIMRGGRPEILGNPAGMPAILEPLISAWTWLPNDPELAYRLTQGLHAVVISLAAVPVYLIARDLGLGRSNRFLLAVVAVVSPDVLYAGYLTADALGYTLALFAVWLALGALTRPSAGRELTFVAFCALCVLARVQYAVLLPAFLVAAVVVERGRLGRVARNHGLLLAAAAMLAGAVLADQALLGWYGAVGGFRISRASLAWVLDSVFLLTVVTGGAVVPGAVAGLASSLRRPDNRAVVAFNALAATLIAGLVVAASLMAVETDSRRFFERYLMVAIPLLAVGFASWIAQGRPGAKLAVLVAAVTLVATARVPLSTFTGGQGRADSPLLLALDTLELRLGVGTAGLVAALVVSIGAVLALVAALTRANMGVTVLVFTIGVLSATLLGAHATDIRYSSNARDRLLAADPEWIDNALGGGDAVLVQTPDSSLTRAFAQVTANATVSRMVVLGRGADTFAPSTRDRLHIGRDGKLSLDGSRPREPLVVATSGSRVVVEDAEVLDRQAGFDLVRLRPRSRISVFVAGLGDDGWLSTSATVAIYPPVDRRYCTALHLGLGLPSGSAPVTLRASGSDGIGPRHPGRLGRIVPARACSRQQDPVARHARVERDEDARKVTLRAR